MFQIFAKIYIGIALPVTQSEQSDERLPDGCVCGSVTLCFIISSQTSSRLNRASLARTSSLALTLGLKEQICSLFEGLRN